MCTMREWRKHLLVLIAGLCLLGGLLTGCDSREGQPSNSNPISPEPDSAVAFSLDTLPEFEADKPWVEVNGNIPYFTDADMTTEAFETYAELDELGRCGVTYANVCQELMPTEARGEIGQVKPTGWQTAKYDNVDGKYLYNRCHLIGFQLTGENANRENLITGTRYLNIEGMLPFENMVADYVHETGNHVLYRVTPIFTGDNLVADGVLMEGYSVEDKGDGILYCIFAYNAQPGVGIDYATGDNWTDPSVGTSETAAQLKPSEQPGTADYVLNTNTMKFHLLDCSSAAKTSEKNKDYYTGSREDLITQGYEPCGVCHP